VQAPEPAPVQAPEPEAEPQYHVVEAQPTATAFVSVTVLPETADRTTTLEISVVFRGETIAFQVPVGHL
jgi:hypothetical protein